MTELDRFREIYWTAFRRPKLKTNKFNDLWLDLEPTSDWLEGPLSSIYDRGNCNYVFKDKEGRFPGVTNADTFLRWCLILVRKHQDSILKTPIRNNDERLDREIMLDIAVTMEELSNLAYKILSNGGQKEVEV